jgi:citrate lyase beta subunit
MKKYALFAIAMMEYLSPTANPSAFPMFMRSKLFVPGSRPEFFAKALAGPADAISIDLEDAVLEERKAEARATVAAFLDGATRTDGKSIIVRVNDPSTVHYQADIAAVALARLDVVNIPKVEDGDTVREAAALLARLERERGIDRPIGLLLNIESPRGLRRATEIAAADPRIVGLQVGFGDLFEPLGIDRKDVVAVHQVLLAVRFAAGEAGVDAWDGAYANVADLPGFQAEAERARRLGFAGKSCIHPSQVATANAAFSPNDLEVGFATRVLAAWADAEARGLGALTFEGHMIDKPFVVRARAVLAAANLSHKPS